MGVIDTPIGDSCFELIRDRIYTIIVDELEQQVAITYDESLMDATVYLERATPLNHAEFPAINIYYAGMVPLRETKNTAHRTYRYFIDFFGKAPTTDTERGDKRAAIKIERLMAVVDKILRDKRYITLGFEQPKIMSTRVQSMEVGKPIDSMQATDAVLARLEFEVDTPEDVVDIQPRSLPGFVTQVVFDDDNGYIFSGSNPPVSPDTINDIYVNNELIVKLNEGEDYNVQVVSGSTGLPIGSWDAYLEQWVIDAVCNPAANQVNGASKTAIPSGGSKNFVIRDQNGSAVTVTEISDNEYEFIGEVAVKSVQFRRTATFQNTQYNTYDAVWRKNNGDFPSLGSDEFQQVIDGQNWWKIKYDDSELTGITQHKFRLIGLNGGYIVPVSPNTANFFDKNGNPSDRATEFEIFGGILGFIDRLTGLLFLTGDQKRNGIDFGYNNYNEAIASLNALNSGGYNGGWRMPSIEEFMDLFGYTLVTSDFNGWWRITSNLNFNNNLISCTPDFTDEANDTMDISNNTNDINSFGRTLTTTSRYYVPTRVFDWNDLNI